MKAVSVKDLCLAYDGSCQVLSGISFQIEEGETVIIAGLSGCGKSSLCHALCGIIPQLIDGEISGEICLYNENIRGRSVAELAKTIALVFQDSDNQLFCTTLEDELAFAPENRCIPPRQIARDIDIMLDATGLTSYRLTDPGRLSGGEKKRAALAAVTMCDPRIIILDEPLSGLDERGRDLVEKMLLELRQKGVTILIVEHDLNAVTARMADRWLILDQGRIVAYDRPQALRKSSVLQELELL